MKTDIKRFSYLVHAILYTVVLLLFAYSRALAIPELSNRSIQSSSGIPSAQVTQTISFSMTTLGTLGSIEFEHCTNSPFIGTPCTAPAGLSLSTAALAAETNNTGFSIDLINSTVNRIVLTRVPGAALAGQNSYSFNSITNPSAANQTVFIRMATYASTDASGARSDTVAVAYSTQGAFIVGAFVPPFLLFCAAVTVSTDCSSTNGSLISLGELVTNQTKYATSQFSGATNDPAGFAVYIIGQTMTAGNQIIPALASPSGSVTGVSQFGINLRANASPSVGSNPSGAGTSVINTNYNTPNLFMFNNGDQLTNSPISTDFNLQTVSYIVNVSNAQAPGYYATTMTYLAVAAF